MRINWNFWNNIFLLISFDLCDKKVLLESLNIPLRCLKTLAHILNRGITLMHCYSRNRPFQIQGLWSVVKVTHSKPSPTQYEVLTQCAKYSFLVWHIVSQTKDIMRFLDLPKLSWSLFEKVCRSWLKILFQSFLVFLK